MIDHVGFPVSDYARSKAFYRETLAPLGYTLINGMPRARIGKRSLPALPNAFPGTAPRLGR